MKEDVAVAVKDYWRQINMRSGCETGEFIYIREARIDNFGSDLYAYGFPWLFSCCYLFLR